MIEPGQVDLNDLVPPETFDAAADAAREAMAADEKSRRLSRALTSVAGPRIAAAMAEKFKQIDLLLLFVEGWAKSQAIAKVAESSNTSAEPRFVRLGKLEQDLDLYPILGISGFGISANPIQFTLNLKAEFEAVEVGLERGCVIQIGGGVCRLCAGLKFGQMSFPSGLNPIEYQVAKGRKFDKPGVRIVPQTGKG